jgi:hypothetical protein
MHKDFVFRLIDSPSLPDTPSLEGWKGECRTLEDSLENYDYIYRKRDFGDYFAVINAFGCVVSVSPEKTRAPAFPVVFVADIFLDGKPLSNRVDMEYIDQVLEVTGHTLQEFDALPIPEQLQHLSAEVALWIAFRVQIQDVRTVPVRLYTVTAERNSLASLELQTPDLEAALDQYRLNRSSGWNNIKLWRNDTVELPCR